MRFFVALRKTRGGLLQQPRNQPGPPAVEAALDCGSRAAAFQETGQEKAGAVLPQSTGCRPLAISGWRGTNRDLRNLGLLKNPTHV